MTFHKFYFSNTKHSKYIVSFRLYPFPQGEIIDVSGCLCPSVTMTAMAAMAAAMTMAEAAVAAAVITMAGAVVVAGDLLDHTPSSPKCIYPVW